ncbi:MAG TPA: hypothetical protein VHO06_04825 [Polyangia bacterium]|nr:hypothetical protein [Polyangia bacterium]
MRSPSVLILFAGIVAGCGKAADTATDAGVAGELRAAEAAWAAAKPSCSTYHYQSTTQSAAFDSCATTTIEIANDQPVRRSLTAYTYGTCGGGDAGPSDSWDETGAAIGSHDDGAPALTIEQLFAACQGDLAQDPKQNSLTLQIGMDGVPIACGHTPNDCVDDCYLGFELSNFACTPWPADAGAGDR